MFDKLIKLEYYIFTKVGDFMVINSSFDRSLWLMLACDRKNRYDIAKDILVGMSKTNCEYKIISDRKDAIKYAIENALDGDIIMLLGKGHEDYKEIKGERIPFDERVIIKELLSEIEN